MVKPDQMEYYKIEIIVDNIYLESVLDLLESTGVLGYSALEITRGKGIQKGESLREGLFTTKSLVFTVVDKDTANKVIDQVQPYLDKRSGVLMIYKIEYASGLLDKLM